MAAINYCCSGPDYFLNVFDPSTGQHFRVEHGGVVGPTWSPDGSLLAFSRRLGPPISAFGIGIYSIKPDGTELTELSNAENVSALNWSPDGRFVAFNTDVPGLGGRAYLLDVASRNVVEITKDLGGAYYLPLPQWSPDGTYLSICGDYR